MSTPRARELGKAMPAAGDTATTYLPSQNSSKTAFFSLGNGEDHMLTEYRLGWHSA